MKKAKFADGHLLLNRSFPENVDFGSWVFSRFPGFLPHKMSTITKSEPFLFLLPASGPQKLSNGVVLIRYDLFC
jgi:hypothetical protein